MLQETREDLAHRILDNLAEGKTDYASHAALNPVTTFTDPIRLAEEKDQLFGGWPLLAGFGCEIPEPGDFLTEDMAGVPVLVVRGRDRSVRAFLNVCRHRGAPVAEGCGHVKNGFVCPYHAWTYGLDGALKGIPDARSFPGIDQADHGLVELPVVEKYGLIWVRTKPGGTIDIDDYLAGLQDDLAAYHLDGFTHFETHTIEQDFNWKIVIDGFLETYHFNVLHRNTVADYATANITTFDAFGPHLRLVVPRKPLTDKVGEAPDSFDLLPLTNIAYVLFPNTMLLMQAGHFETWRTYPAGNAVDRFTTKYSLYAPEPIESERARNHWARNIQVGLSAVRDEDFAMSERIQHGYTSGAQANLTYGRNEAALIHYHDSLNLAMGREPLERVKA